MFFDDWAGLVRVVVVGTCGHLTLLALLRVSGRRSLAAPNAFDFVVTVARLTVRSHAVERVVGSEPTPVYRYGFLEAPMRRMRVTEDEIRQCARTAGNTRMDTVAAGVLETDGSMSILTEVPAVLDHTGPDDLKDPRP